MTVDAFGLGGGSTDLKTRFKTMVAYITTVNHYMTFEQPVGTDFQVPAGNTLYITKIQWINASASGGFYIYYGDDGVASGAPAPTNPVQLTWDYRDATANVLYDINVLIPIPAGKYPCAKAVAGVLTIQIFGMLIPDQGDLMTLTECNHAITEIKTMLNGLVASEVISGQDSQNLLPVLVELRLKNETIKTE